MPNTTITAGITPCVKTLRARLHQLQQPPRVYTLQKIRNDTDSPPARPWQIYMATPKEYGGRASLQGVQVVGGILWANQQRISFFSA